MANGNTKIQEQTITVGNRRMIISEEGIWVDSLNPNGTVDSSVAVAWEELATHEADSYMSLYEVIRGEDNLPALRKAG
ncbi:hypothetical protein M0R72_00695 [Candidatus Pacearchaeota archaeon]|jgi:hypothetical protein|nr:hypothetical protein [Candidatus Pacearchaeota archaeon]